MKRIEDLFDSDIVIKDNLVVLKEKSEFINQQQTNEKFSTKWETVHKFEERRAQEEFQFKWYLKLYGFDDEKSLAEFLKDKEVILDAGCGLGYKAAWFARLAPNSTVIGMDFSNAIYLASQEYSDLKNLYFVKGDIADTHLKERSIDYINCDQVIHHTENPHETFRHLSNRITNDGQFACYVYAKKALPRELLDDYFREFSKECSDEELWELSRQLTDLGKTLSDLNIEIEVPDMKLLQIKGGKYDLQRFIYWNLMKCFWNSDMGYDNSVSANYDWYAPSNAKRYSEQEYKELIKDNNLEIEYFHGEEACYSGRFKR